MLGSDSHPNLTSCIRIRHTFVSWVVSIRTNLAECATNQHHTWLAHRPRGARGWCRGCSRNHFRKKKKVEQRRGAHNTENNAECSPAVLHSPPPPRAPHPPHSSFRITYSKKERVWPRTAIIAKRSERVPCPPGTGLLHDRQNPISNLKQK